jgi:ribosomal protein S27AE
MLNLDVFSPVELRRAKEVVAMFPPSTTAAEMLRAISSVAVDHDARFTADPAICPSCGRGHLSTLATIDGLRRRGCRRCYYSEVV